MKYKLLFLSFITAMLVVALPAIGQNIKQEAQNIKTTVREFNKEEVQQFQAKRQEAQAQLQKQKEEFKNKLEAVRAEAKTRIEKQREELKTRLEKIKDETKKQTVEKIANQINGLNEQMTKHFSDVLSKLDDILGRISSRTDKAETNGRDVSAVKTAIADAKTAIAAARSAIEVQSKKTYDMTISAEDALRRDVSKAREALRNDLVKVREAVFAARDAAHKAATTLGQIQGVNELEVQ